MWFDVDAEDFKIDQVTRFELDQLTKWFELGQEALVVRSESSDKVV